MNNWKESQGLKKMLQELGLSKSEEGNIVIKLINACARNIFFIL